MTVENVGAWDPRNTTLFHALEPMEPLEFRAHVDDRDTFAPTFDMRADGTRYDDLTADWSEASLDAAFSTAGTHPLVGHVAGDGPLAGRYVTATVDVVGPVNVCLEPGTTVSASFHQTKYDTFPPEQACDGDISTSWSTWASGSDKQDQVTFTVSAADEHTIDEVRFTSTEGAITAVGVEYQDDEGAWRPTTAQSGSVAPHGELTTLAFDPVVTSGVRLTFDTPGSYLKITEIMVPGSPPPPPSSVAVEAAAECRGRAAFVVARVANVSDASVGVTVSALGESRERDVVRPGRSWVLPFGADGRAVDGGKVTVLAGGVETAHAYDARSCA